MIYNTILTQIRLIVSFAEIIIVYSIFLFNDFRNNVLRGSRYIYYLNLSILKNIFDDDATTTLIFLSDFLIREILDLLLLLLLFFRLKSTCSLRLWCFTHHATSSF